MFVCLISFLPNCQQIPFSKFGVLRQSLRDRFWIWEMDIWKCHLNLNLKAALNKVSFFILPSRAVENPESARSVIYANLSAHSAYLNVSRQKVPYFNVSRQKVSYFNVSLQKCRILTFRDKTESYSTVLQQNMLMMWGQASLSFVISLPEGRRASQR